MKIEALGASVKLRTISSGQPFITDEGHHILDCAFGTILIPPPWPALSRSMPGVVEHGMFIGMAKVALIGKGNEVLELRSS